MHWRKNRRSAAEVLELRLLMQILVHLAGCLGFWGLEGEWMGCGDGGGGVMISHASNMYFKSCTDFAKSPPKSMLACAEHLQALCSSEKSSRTV